MSINENGDVIDISFNKEDHFYLKVRIIFENVDEVNLIERAVFSNTVGLLSYKLPSLRKYTNLFLPIKHLNKLSPFWGK